MKKLKDYEDEIYKCSRCGLCQSVCPVYKATLNECAVSRGKFNILNGIIKGELKLNSTVKKYLDLCTGCNACHDFCPSKIDVKDIFTTAKSEYYRTNKPVFFEKIINSYLLFKLVMWSGCIFFFIYRLLKLNKAVKVFSKLIIKTGTAGKRIVLLNTLAECRYKNKNSVSKNKIRNAIYFEGCFNKYLNSETKEAVKKILADSDIKLIQKNFECCGISYLNDGNIEQFKKLLDKNLNKIDSEYEYVITDCASCAETLKSYKLFSNKKAANNLSKKTIMLTDVIKNINFQCSEPFKIAVHKPCHDSYDFIEIVKNIKGTDYTEAKDFDKCCGFSGKFALQNQEISRKISKQKAQNYIDANVDFILTTCPACQLGLNQGLAELSDKNSSLKQPEVMNLYVFLAKYCRKIN